MGVTRRVLLPVVAAATLAGLTAGASLLAVQVARAGGGQPRSGAMALAASSASSCPASGGVRIADVTVVLPPAVLTVHVDPWGWLRVRPAPDQLTAAVSAYTVDRGAAPARDSVTGAVIDVRARWVPA